MGFFWGGLCGSFVGLCEMPPKKSKGSASESPIAGKRRGRKPKDEESDDTGLAEVERIVGQRKVKGQLQYRVKWAGHGAEHNT
jgi:hypothetical protein